MRLVCSLARNRLGLKTLGLGLTLLLGGCNRDSPPSPSSAAPNEPPAALSVHRVLTASSAVSAEDPANPPPDPPAPAGDLRAEVEAFTTLDACVAARTPFDPLLGDAIDALGYDTLRRDACRVLQAIKNKNAASCEPIISSSLRMHCIASVAIASGDTLQCPMVEQQHDSFCAALTQRDARLCTQPDAARKTLCRAVIARDPSKCQGDEHCKRYVLRWKSLLPESTSGAQAETHIELRIDQRADGGLTPLRSLDLSELVQPIAVQKGATSLVRVMLGEASSALWPPASMQSQPRLALTLRLMPEELKPGKHALGADRIDIAVLLPHVTTFATQQLTGPAELTVERFGTEIGAPVRFTLEADLEQNRDQLRLKLAVSSFVRDLVQKDVTAEPRPAAALPPPAASVLSPLPKGSR